MGHPNKQARRSCRHSLPRRCPARQKRGYPLFGGGTSGLDEAQVDAMFDEAVARARLGKRQKPLQSECIMCLT